MGKFAVFVVLLIILSPQIEGAVTDCYDACSTACVGKDQRLMLRCDRKCQIKCDPGFPAEVGHD